MVKRWYNWCTATHKHEMAPSDQGPYVRYSDYESLQAALREALDGWGHTVANASKNGKRIAALRKEFLE
jgi:hypothetical protein